MWNDEDQLDGAPGYAPRKGMSTGMKILIVLLCLGGVLFLLCGGCVIYVVSQVKHEVKQDDPQAAAQTAQEIVTIEVPEQFQPSDSVKMGGELFGFGMKMKVATFRSAEGHGSLVLMQMQMKIRNMPQQDQAELARQQLRQQDLHNTELNVVRSEQREFEIRGQKVPFLFAEAKQPETDTAFRQVSGAFAVDQGMVMLLLQVEEEAYDEEAVVRMLESIE